MSQEDGYVPGLFSHEHVAPEAYTPADADAPHHRPVFSGAEDGSFQRQVAEGEG